MSHTLADLVAVKTRILADITAAADLTALDTIRVAGLGKKGEVSLMMRGLGKMSPDEKKVMGPALNGVECPAGVSNGQGHIHSLASKGGVEGCIFECGFARLNGGV